MENFEDSKNRTVTGQLNDHCPVPRAAKTHQEYWKTRIKRRPFRDGRGAVVVPPEYSVRMFHLGREVWFNLETANQSAGAVKARDIYLSLVAAGWIATLEKYKPSPMARADVCTVGEFLTDVASRGHLKPMTVRRYAVKLRKLVSDVAKLEAGLKGKAKRA